MCTRKERTRWLRGLRRAVWCSLQLELWKRGFEFEFGRVCVCVYVCFSSLCMWCTAWGRSLDGGLISRPSNLARRQETKNESPWTEFTWSAIQSHGKKLWLSYQEFHFCWEHGYYGILKPVFGLLDCHCSRWYKVKVKFTLWCAMKAQTGCGSVVVLCL